MKLKYAKYIYIAFIAALTILIVSCSTKNNTSQTRWWHAFNAKYNTYYNGAQAYIDASIEKENGNKDNFTEMIPLYTVGNKASKDLGKANFERAIEKAEKAIARHSIKKKPEWNKSRRKTEKDIEWLSRREYNPFLWKAWMLMGRSQFYKGSFEDAATTFSYMSRLYRTQPAIYGKARAWLAKSYIEAGWLYDAEDVIRNIQRDSIDWRAVREWDYTFADYYIHTGELDKAVPYLRRVIKQEMRRKQKAREWYLMGQIQAALGNKDAAYNAFQHVIRSNPPYELEFNARVAATEVMAAGQTKQMVNRLKRMVASDKNKDYLDQVFYAMGNIYLTNKDTLNAIAAYEQGYKKSTRSGIEKGVLLLRLGNLYWEKEKFSDARRCYNEALGLLDKDRKDYEQLSERTKVLDELTPHTEAVQLQDSLQYLAKCPESERFAAIDRVINALKKKEKEERNRQAEQEATQQMAQNGGINADNDNPLQRPTRPNRQQQDATWYFYNPIAVQQGKATFQQLWGKRENIDNWQRINKTVVGGITNTNELSNAQRDSIAKEEAKLDSISNKRDSAQNDPHKRAYYLAQIPFTPEQLAASNKILEAGLHHSGVIFKDRLDNLRLAEKALRRVSDNYPDYEQMDDVYYHLYLLYMRKGETTLANSYIDKLKTKYPKSQWTALLTDPYFKENAKFGEHIEDSLYASTYEAFKNNRFSEVAANKRISDERFPMGANRDKFLFIDGLNKLNQGNINGCIDEMKTVVEKYPQSRISEMAGMIVNGVKAGKKIHNSKFDLGDVWNYRTNVLNDSDSIKQVKFSPDRDIDFKFLLVYNPDSLSENKLLFEMARFNFTSFYVRNFEIEIENIEGLHQMALSGFRSFDEAYQYARQLFNNKNVIAQLSKDTKAIIISNKNLQLIGTSFSYKDYEDFYAKHFAPLQVTKHYLLSEPAEVATPREKERDLQEEIESKNPTETDLNAREQGLEPIDNGMTIPIEDEKKTENKKVAPTEIVVPAEEPAKKEEPKGNTNNNEVIIPVEETTNKKNSKNNVNNTEIVVPIEDSSKKKKTGNTINNTEMVIPIEGTSNKKTETKPIEPKKEQKTIEQIGKNVVTIDNSVMEIPLDSETSSPQTTVGAPSNKQKTVKTKNSETTSDKKKLQNSKNAQKPQQPSEKKEQPKKKNTDSTVIYFDDDVKTTDKKKKESQKQQPLDYDFDDEYYDLGGF